MHGGSALGGSRWLSVALSTSQYLSVALGTLLRRYAPLCLRSLHCSVVGRRSTRYTPANVHNVRCRANVPCRVRHTPVAALARPAAVSTLRALPSRAPSCERAPYPRRRRRRQSSVKRCTSPSAPPEKSHGWVGWKATAITCTPRTVCRNVSGALCVRWTHRGLWVNACGDGHHPEVLGRLVRPLDHLERHDERVDEEVGVDAACARAMHMPCTREDMHVCGCTCMMGACSTSRGAVERGRRARSCRPSLGLGLGLGLKFGLGFGFGFGLPW